MKLDRRECLKLGVLAGAGIATAGCSGIARRVAGRKVPEHIELPSGDVSPEYRVLNRLAFGAIPGEPERVRQIGRKAYVDEQLDPSGDEEPALLFQLSRLDTLRMDAGEMKDLPRGQVIRELQMGALLRATYSRHQLQERMVDFWSNHFNVYVLKGDTAFRKGADDTLVIRKNALGKFSDLLKGSAHSAAMIGYLDNQVNRQGHANENYAREIMELHTLGVHGGYTQKDVQEVARCLTGWTISDRMLHRDKYVFNPDAHDDGAKRVLGVDIPAGGGEKDGDRVLEILANHPSTAKFISGKICKYFLGDDGSSWSDKMAETYMQTGGDIKAMLRPLLLSDVLLSSGPILKRPFDFQVSAMRAFNAQSTCDNPTQKHLEMMGQPLFEWPMPDGYPDKTSAWTGSLLARWNYAAALCAGDVGDTSVDFDTLFKSGGASSPREKADLLLSLTVGKAADSQGTIEKYLTETGGVGGAAALCLALPEFQWR